MITNKLIVGEQLFNSHLTTYIVFLTCFKIKNFIVPTVNKEAQYVVR